MGTAERDMRRACFLRDLLSVTPLCWNLGGSLRLKVLSDKGQECWCSGRSQSKESHNLKTKIATEK